MREIGDISAKVLERWQQEGRSRETSGRHLERHKQYSYRENGKTSSKVAEPVGISGEELR